MGELKFSIHQIFFVQNYSKEVTKGFNIRLTVVLAGKDDIFNIGFITVCTCLYLTPPPSPSAAFTKTATANCTLSYYLPTKLPPAGESPHNPHTTKFIFRAHIFHCTDGRWICVEFSASDYRFESLHMVDRQPHIWCRVRPFQFLLHRISASKLCNGQRIKTRQSLQKWWNSKESERGHRKKSSHVEYEIHIHVVWHLHFVKDYLERKIAKVHNCAFYLHNSDCFFVDEEGNFESYFGSETGRR